MDFEQDFIMRMVKQLAAAMMNLLLGKKVAMVELPKEEQYTSSGDDLKYLFDLINEGNINEAENELLDDFCPQNPDDVEKAISFYSYLNKLDDNYLIQHNYSREEIYEGLTDIAKRAGLSDMIEMFNEE